MKIRAFVGASTLALTITTTLAVPVLAASINIQAMGNNPVPINTVGNLPAVMVNNNGVGSQVYQNKTGDVFTDFSFTVDTAQSDILDGNGGTFFDRTQLATKSRITFLKGNTGTGIDDDQIFTVTFSGFSANANITGAPSITPEPSSLLLLAFGVLGLLAVRSHFSRTQKR